MPNPNDRYPLVAIPKCIFDALRRDLEKDHDNPYAMVSVNEYVQSMLNHSPMYDYLIRLEVQDSSGAKMIKPLLGDPSLSLRGWDMDLKKVRVTKSQFEMLSQRQAQYASDHLRIPISCIVSSMLYQWSKSVRAIFETVPGQWVDFEELQPQAWMYGDVEGCRTQLCFHQKHDGEWKSFHWNREEGLTSPNVIVGWNPQKRGLRGLNPCTLGDD